MTRSVKAKARNKKQKGAEDDFPAYRKDKLTMQQEARNTEGRSLWRAGVSLRHRAVQFVSAQDLQPDQENEPQPAELDKDELSKKPQEPCANKSKTTSTPAHQAGVEDTPLCLNPAGNITPVSNPDPGTGPSPICIDSSEDEIVFRGRRTEQYWKAQSTNPLIPHSIAGTTGGSRPGEGIGRKKLELSLANPDAEFISVSDDASNLRRRRNSNTFVPIKHGKQKQKLQRFTKDEDDVLADYIANIDDEYLMLDNSSQSTEVTGHDLEAIEPAAPITRPGPMNPRVMKLSVLDKVENTSQAHEKPTLHENEATCENSDQGLLTLSGQENHENAKTQDDWNTQQLHSDSELIVSSGASDAEDDEANELDDLETLEGNFFASATAFADALELDPYYGFDIMDYNRPSLRGKDHPFDDMLSDSDLESRLANAWQSDRNKKKLRKQKREELRSQGLLGRTRQGPVLKTKYANGIDSEDLKSEIRNFLLSPNNRCFSNPAQRIQTAHGLQTSDNDLCSLALPSMAKQHRKLVHELANALCLNSQSRGKGSSRFPIIHKTSRTPVYTQKTSFQMDRILYKGRLGQRGFKPRDQNSTKTSKSRRGRPDSSVSYMDGDVVGGSAPEIGSENKGRAMLEKMGWSIGTPLGATNNKGILLPVAHVVKNSRAGLG
ncbi:hypothetical protein BO71DRAFT_408705 [Aspergillus ellipticus CBS 707.79]|uniref:Protein SQS1 n=1 Tax=Aspergillus ellipticus CBS 707.79 TaxID=1448320 RepID=A0A319DD46_9EURO|nr:hypothetical protein BO71DRAFT_408705 [Aspergillus ellipticus CBS 707.79]